jgi:hypothetical protein
MAFKRAQREWDGIYFCSGKFDFKRDGMDGWMDGWMGKTGVHDDW